MENYNTRFFKIKKLTVYKHKSGPNQLFTNTKLPDEKQIGDQ